MRTDFDNDLQRAIYDEWEKNPPKEGWSAPEMHARVADRFPLITWLDVYDEMRNLFGPPKN